MKLICIPCLDFGNYYLNPDNISFVSTGEKREATQTTSAGTQLFFHFVGGKESCMIWVAEPQAAITELNRIQ